MMLELPFIVFSVGERCLFLLCSTRLSDTTTSHAFGVSSAPCRLPASREILTSWPTHSLAFPRLCMLLAVIIRGDLLMIPFLILAMGIFLFSGALDKTQTDVHLVVFKLGVQLTKLGLVCTLCHSSCISLGHAKLWNEHAQLRLCMCAKLNPKLWVPTGPHHYYLAHPRANC
jgi:hypothetical protein